MNVKIFDLERDHHEIKGELIRIFEEVLSRGEYILGPEVKALEEAFAQYIGVKYAIGVNNGTDAIRIGGFSLGLTKGDKVVTTPNTYIASAMAFSTHGVTPCFCDIEADTYNMDPGCLEDLLKNEKGIKVCVPVHLYGHAARMDEIAEICGRYGVKILEDACQAHGATYKGRKVGGLGDAATFSFYPTKNLGCYGDGGIIVTDSDIVYDEAMKLRNYGQGKDRHVHLIDGFNSRLDEVQAAFLKYKLRFLDGWNNKRRALAAVYTKALADTPVVLPQEASWTHHVYHLFVIRSDKRDELRTYLAEKGITALIHYPTPIHLQKVYEHLGYKAGSFPIAEKAAQEILSLPMYPSLREDEVLYVCDAIRAFYGK
ncbi:MAG: transcriptional regulator [Syntrophus sp. (in: bacteria)]|nr:transcriptional regulator [Syntrophus sp. (in: bacteria)]